MLKNLSSVLVLVALGYVGYLANQYFANPSSSAATTAAAAAAPATNAPVPPPPSGEMLILQKDVNAYDPVDPTKIRGKFVKGTQLEIGAQSSTAHMWHVVYRPSSTNWFMLLCKGEDIGKESPKDTSTDSKIRTAIPGTDFTAENLNKSKGGLGQK